MARIPRRLVFLVGFLVAAPACAQNAATRLTVLDFDYGASRSGVQTLARSSVPTWAVALGPRSRVFLLSEPGDATVNELIGTLSGLQGTQQVGLSPVPELSYHYGPDPTMESAPMHLVSVIEVSQSSQTAYENAQRAVSNSAAQAGMTFSWSGFRQTGAGEPIVYYYFTPIDSYGGIDRINSAFVARAANQNSLGFAQMIEARAVLDKVTLSVTQFVVRRATATAMATARP